MNKCVRKLQIEYDNVMKNTDDTIKARECRDKKSKTDKDIIKLDEKNKELFLRSRNNRLRFIKKLEKTKSPSKQKSLRKKRRSYVKKDIAMVAKNFDKQKVILSKVCKKELSEVSKDTKQKLIDILSKQLKCKEEVEGRHKPIKLLIKKLKSKNNKNLLDVLY